MAFSFAFPCHWDYIQIVPCHCTSFKGWKRKKKKKSSVLIWTALCVLFITSSTSYQQEISKHYEQICIQTSSKRKSIVQALCHFVDKKKGIPRSFTPDDLYFFNFFKHLSASACFCRFSAAWASVGICHVTEHAWHCKTLSRLSMEWKR